jgi:hypothetical protein
MMRQGTAATLHGMGLLRVLDMLQEADRIYERRYGPAATGPRATIYMTSLTRGSGLIDSHSARTRSRAGSNEHAMVRMSPASAFR